MTPAEKVIRAFGGVAALRKALGHKYDSNIKHWRLTGRIPATRQREILKAAVAAEIELDPADLVDKVA